MNISISFDTQMPAEFVPKAAESKFDNKRVSNDKGTAKEIRKGANTPASMEVVRLMLLRRVVLAVLSLSFGAEVVADSTVIPARTR